MIFEEGLRVMSNMPCYINVSRILSFCIWIESQNQNYSRSFILKFSSGEDSLPPPTDPSGIFAALEPILQPRGRHERSRGGRGRGWGPGRPPLHKRGPGRPPQNGSCIIVKGRSKKDDIPNTCHLCHLDIEEEEVDSLVDCRNCRKLGLRDCEEATGEDCGTF